MLSPCISCSVTKQAQDLIAGTNDLLIKSFLVAIIIDININKRLQGCMSNKCRKVVTLQALTEIHRIYYRLKTISGQTILTYTEMGMVTVHFLPESHYPGRYR